MMNMNTSEQDLNRINQPVVQNGDGKPPTGFIRPFTGMPGQDGTVPNFPTSAHLPKNHYPNLNNATEDMKFGMVDSLVPQLGWNNQGAKNTLDNNMQPGGTWDVTKNPAFPGTSASGETEYGLFNNQRVTGKFMNHHLYGSTMAMLGYQPDFSGQPQAPEQNDFGLGEAKPKTYTANDVPKHLQGDLPAITSGFQSVQGDPSWQGKPFVSNQSVIADSPKNTVNPFFPGWKPPVETLDDSASDASGGVNPSDNTNNTGTPGVWDTRPTGSPPTGSPSQTGPDNGFPQQQSQPYGTGNGPVIQAGLYQGVYSGADDLQPDNAGQDAFPSGSPYYPDTNPQTDDTDTHPIWQAVQQATGGVGRVLKRQHQQAWQQFASGNSHYEPTFYGPMNELHIIPKVNYRQVPVSIHNVTPMFKTDLMREASGLPLMNSADLKQFDTNRDQHQNFVTQKVAQIHAAQLPQNQATLNKAFQTNNADTSQLGNQGVKSNQIANASVTNGIHPEYHDGNTGYMFLNHDSYQQSENDRKTEIAARVQQQKKAQIKAYWERMAASKTKFFPTNPNLPISYYPDVTKDFEVLRDSAIRTIVTAYLKASNIKDQLWEPRRILFTNFPTGRPWDIKSLPNFPNIDANGHTQYAVYRGKVVSSTYLTNDFYGQVLKGSGFSRMEALFAADMNYRWSEREHEFFLVPDQPDDQQAIKAGYYEWKHLYGHPILP